MEHQPLRILNVEDSALDSALIHNLLQQEGIACTIDRLDTQEKFLEKLQSGEYDLILCDYNLPGFDGLTALSLALQHTPHTPFIFVSGTIGEERAIDALKQGATDYVLKDRLTRLPHAIQRALREKEAELQRLNAERLLRSSETRYRTIFENSGTAIAIVEEDMTLSLVNSNFAELTGYRKEEIHQKMKWTEIVHPDELPRMKEYHILRRTSPKSVPREYEFRLRRKSGEIRHVHATIEMVPETNTSIASLIDITERKQAEEQLRQQAALLDIDPDAIMVRDTDDRILFWNKGAERLYEWTKEEMIGKRWSEIQFGGMEKEYTAAVQTVFEHSEWRGEWTHKTKSGKEVIVDSLWELVKDEKGNPKAIYVVNTDITEKKKIEAQYLRAQRLESIGTLAGGIAHDLNNVLAPILLAVQILRKKLPDPADAKTLDMLESVAKRGADMVKHILTFSRGIEGQHMAVVPKHLLQELEQMIRQTFPRNIDIEIRTSPDLWMFQGDPTQINQVLLNLCVNARDAMPKGGVLTIVAENTTLDKHTARFHPHAQAGPYVLFTVSDTGMGIPPHLLEKIFEPFFTTKDVGKGTGLGLSTSYGIVRSHGGFITVYSEVGKGSQFKVYFPATPSKTAQRAEQQAEELPMGNGETVLVIDDEASILEITKTMLESYGYNVLTAADGAEGVVVCAKHADEIKAIVCDMNMPLMDGPATIRAVRKILPEVKVIAVSGLMSDEHAVQLEDAAKIRFLQKPYSAEKLLKVLEGMLRK